MKLNFNGTSLAAGALVMSALLLAITPTSVADDTTTTDAAKLADDIQKGADHVDAVDLARKIIAEEHDYVLVDLRDPEDYAQYHIPTAVNIPIRDLVAADTLPGFGRKTVILYSGNQVHAGQAWLLLMQKGTPAKVLKEGLQGWWWEVMTPAALRGDLMDPKAAAAAEALRSYFAGNTASQATTATLTTSAPPAPAAPTAEKAPPAKPSAKKPVSGC
jgi:rhodanese-related sulfurtransferase